ncbi:hypothetical protein [Conexibacter sp. CPCC 206217]|uniref:hypothetical protein n=1 Tax=Conexibacter sp. CPCC 206217 TaxID=3064574 RepID=UPI002719CD0A|nr:hypothetical protein [Conexibacter sp. CPCC 206217]MDO8208943.1 hypothetical protein [Conexibacter sp. CPCC 206217]
MKTFVTAIGAALVVLLAPAITTAATFEVRVCADAPALTASAATASNSQPTTLAATAACRRDPVSQFDGLAATDVSGAPNASAGAGAGWTITAVPGTRIVSARVRRYLGKRSNSWQVWTRTGEGQTLDTCEITSAISCTVGAIPTDPQSIVTYPNLDTEALTWGISCRPSLGDCATGVSLRSAWAVVYGATVTVNDPEPPQLQPLAGGLVAATRWHAGIEQAIVSASAASGIRRLELLVDGAAATATDQSCDYTQMRPCPRDAQLTASVDLATLTDGIHQVAGLAVDAAGQSTTSAPTAIAVDTHAPSAPVSMAVSRNVDATVNARWGNPDRGTGAPIVAVQYQFCPIASDVGCVGSGIVAGDGINSLERIRPPAGSAPWDLVIWLQDAAGHADRAAAARQLIAPTKPPPDPEPRRPSPPKAGRQPTRLRIAGVARRGGWLRVRGTAVRAFTGKVRVALRRSRHGRFVTRRTVVVRNGGVSTRLDVRGRRSLSGYLVTIHFPGSAEFRTTTALRRLGRN